MNASSSAPVAVPRVHQSIALALHGGVAELELDRLLVGDTLAREGCEVRLRQRCDRAGLAAFLGPCGARLMRALYTIANDEPNWRNPHVVIEANALLDHYGYLRSRGGYHYTYARRSLSALLAAAHAVEVTPARGQRAALVDLLSPMRAGSLPRVIELRLGQYEGVRAGPARLGNDYVLVPRGEITRYGGRTDRDALLAAYLRARQRQLGRDTFVLRLETLLRRLGVRDQRLARGRRRLVAALERLLHASVLERFEVSGQGRAATVRFFLPAPARAIKARAYGG